MPDLPLNDRPSLDLAQREILDIYQASPVGTGKILKNQAQWRAYAEKADAVAQGYREYIEELFTPKEPEKPPKKWWQFWK